MTMQPTPARAPMTAQGASVLRPTQGSQLFGARLEPQILRNTPMQILRTTPSWAPPAAPPARPVAGGLAALMAPPAALSGPGPAQQPAPIPPPAAAPAPAAPAAVAATPPPAAATPSSGPADGGPPLGPDEYAPIPGEMTFAQFVQGLNPLHHLPGVGTIYRAVTGAEIHPVMRVLGGAVFGGPLGMILAAIGSAFEQTRPLERLGHTLAGRPDPEMPAPNSQAARAAAAYARFGTPG